MRSARVLAFTLACASAIVVLPCRADDAARGYADIRQSLVKVWSFDAAGHPFESGSGIVIVSNHARSLVLTAAHVVAGAASIKIDIDRDRHDLVAHVQQRGPHDLAILTLERGDLTPATFAPRAHAVVEGNVIAVAGFVKNDELIGIVGQEPRLLYPGTISSRPEDGAYLELENVHVEEGLSGGPVFDPDTGDVLGIVTSRTSDQRGGFADSAAQVVVPFLASNAIAFRERGDARIVASKPKSAVTPAPAPAPAAQPTAAPSAVAARRSPVTVKPRAPAVAPVAFIPPPFADPAPAPRVVRTPEPQPEPTEPSPPQPQAWEAQDTSPHRLAYDYRGCSVVLTVAVRRLAFTLPGTPNENVAANARLTLRVGRRVAAVAACQDVAESDPADGTYEAAATSYDGRHVTIRFRYVPGPDATAAEGALFPADISVDADVTQAPVTAHVQLIDADWDGALDVIASKDR